MIFLHQVDLINHIKNQCFLLHLDLSDNYISQQEYEEDLYSDFSTEGLKYQKKA